MGYSIQHLRIDKKHILTLIDEQTTLPSLFVAIYSIRKLSLLRFRTQEKELFTLKYFFEFWENKFSKTFDFSFRESNYDIANCISELDGFYHHLSNKKHLRSTKNIVSIQNSSFESCRSNAEHLRTISKFFQYLNQRYMNQSFQRIDQYELCKSRDWNERCIKSIVRNFCKVQPSGMKHNPTYRSLTKEQLLCLDEMLLPSSPLISESVPKENASVYKNKLNPFASLFLQFRTYIIHRLMFNYGLRIGEVLLLTVESLGASKPNHLGEIRYILSVNNLPSHINDPRKEPITIKNRFSLREILLDEKDYYHIKYYINELRNPLFIKTDKSIENDSQLLFITNRGSCGPITYDTVQKYYAKIDLHYNSLYSDRDFYTLMPKITPHVGRHSWAYITLEYIYNNLFNEEVILKRQYGINSRLNGLLDAASEQLRNLGGWSLNSKMPYRYAKRFLSELANKNNLLRIKNNKEQTSSIITPTVDNKYDPFL